jgi:hypothetical protein
MTSLSELRLQLETMGIDTGTPGIKGEARRATLEERLWGALEAEQAGGSARSEINTSASAPVLSRPADGPPPSQMKMSELRRELELRGLDTRTPGLTVRGCKGI